MPERTPEQDQELALAEVEGKDLDDERLADETEVDAVATGAEVPEADAIEQAMPGPPDDDAPER